MMEKKTMYIVILCFVLFVGAMFFGLFVGAQITCNTSGGVMTDYFVCEQLNEQYHCVNGEPFSIDGAEVTWDEVST